MWDSALTRNTVQNGEAGTPAALRLWLDILKIQFLLWFLRFTWARGLQITSLGVALGGCSLVPAGFSACREQDQD